MDKTLLERMRTALKVKKEFPSLKQVSSVLQPSQEYASKGHKAIKAGKVGTIILAGGMGTRLKFPHPKGLYPITLVRHKTLYQLVAEKTHAASKAYGVDLKIAFMTSPQNDKDTVDYFKEKGRFGLKEEQLSFFMQEELPFLDDKGEPFSGEPKGPDGNGRVFEHFKKSGLLEQWVKNGIEYINIILIDNPLAEPFDANLIGALIKNEKDVIVKAVKKETSEEKTGTLVLANDRLKVIEYTELPENERGKHLYANISLFALTLSFAKELASQHLPLHVAYKPLTSQSTINGYKFETFIFDLLDYTNKADVMVFDKDACFAPLKNSVGLDSPTTVQHALEQHDRKTLSEITGHRILNQPLELDPAFYYPTQKLLSQWTGKNVDESLHYIIAE